MQTDDRIPPSMASLLEARVLSEDILKNIELNELPLSNVALKAARLARLLNDFAYQEVMKFEASGYPSDPGGVTPVGWAAAQLAGRVHVVADPPSPTTKQAGGTKELADVESLAVLEERITTAQIALQSAKDRDISISSSNPYQHVTAPMGNQYERYGLQRSIASATARLSKQRAFIHEYVLAKNLELRYSGVASDVFSRIRSDVDGRIGAVIPHSVNKFASVHENLLSDNPEDWSNAVHSCRRILQDLADVLFPQTDTPRLKDENGKVRSIKLGEENYVNRLVCYVEDHSESSRFQEIVGSHLAFIGDRLDSAFRAAQKGSHSTVTREEADRYVVYTYMIVGDILSLS
jgi:hypothetical protein